jgi:CxxC motif-containing protein (DUF1111 family)
VHGAAAGLSGSISFRIPTPLFGLGLVENTPDATLEADADKQAGAREMLRIKGHFNHKQGGLDGSGTFNLSGNTGAIMRFGWKAQNPTLEVFAGEALNVELGVTNELFGRKADLRRWCENKQFVPPGTTSR